MLSQIAGSVAAELPQARLRKSRGRAQPVACSFSSKQEKPAALAAIQKAPQRLAAAAAAAAMALSAAQAPLAFAAGGVPGYDGPVLCDAACTASIEKVEAVTTPSGLVYKDIVKGSGPTPKAGFQVVVDYVAMTQDLRVFESTLEKGKPSDIRVTSGGEDGPASVIKGMNEGLQTMQPGGLRRLYIPGDLAFVKGLASAPGRPRVPPLSPVVFDIKLVYIPGLEDLE